MTTIKKMTETFPRSPDLLAALGAVEREPAHHVVDEAERQEVLGLVVALQDAHGDPEHLRQESAPVLLERRVLKEREI